MLTVDDSGIRESGAASRSPVGNTDATASANQAGADPLIGSIIAGRYKIKELLASGGWGNVYRATHISLNIDVAVKFIHRNLANIERLTRFELEAILLHRLNSPYIIRFLDYCGKPSQAFIVMEYFDGSSLEALLTSGQVLEPETALDFFLLLTRGLNAAGELGLVHRDLKPSNVLYRFTENKLDLRIIDFGIAKLSEELPDRLTATGEVLGSPLYMAPEHWAGNADHRSDIYAAGCIMYEALSGKHPFSGSNTIELLDQHAHTAPQKFADIAPQLNIPQGLESVIRKCMQKDPAHRYQTSEALHSDLEKIKQGGRVLIWLPDDRRRELMLAMILTWILAVAATFFLLRDPVLSYCVDSLNASAKKDFDFGNDREALKTLERSAGLAAYLPKHDSRKLQAMQMLSLVLCLNGQMKQAERLDANLSEIQAAQDTLGKAAEAAARKKPHINEMIMPNRFHAEEIEYIDISPDRLWQELGNFENMAWHPAVRSCKVVSNQDERRLMISSDRVSSSVQASHSPGSERVVTEKLLGAGERSMCYKLTSGLPVHPIQILKVDHCPSNPERSVVTLSANFFEPNLDPARAKFYAEFMLDYYVQGLKSLQKKYNKQRDLF